MNRINSLSKAITLSLLVHAAIFAAHVPGGIFYEQASPIIPKSIINKTIQVSLQAASPLNVLHEPEKVPESITTEVAAPTDNSQEVMSVEVISDYMVVNEDIIEESPIIATAEILVEPIEQNTPSIEVNHESITVEVVKPVEDAQVKNKSIIVYYATLLIAPDGHVLSAIWAELPMLTENEFAFLEIDMMTRTFTATGREERMRQPLPL